MNRNYETKYCNRICIFFYIISAPVCFKFNLTIIETNYIIDMDYRFHEISADRLHRMSFRMQAKAAYSNIC